MSDKKIDHKAEALVAIAAVSELGLASDEGYYKQELLAEAQVHATLYLAEQQRIANLIAWTGDGHVPTPVVAQQIIEGLGL